MFTVFKRVFIPYSTQRILIDIFLLSTKNMQLHSNVCLLYLCHGITREILPKI